MLKICRYNFLLWLKSRTAVPVRGGFGSLSLDASFAGLELYSVNTPLLICLAIYYRACQILKTLLAKPLALQTDQKDGCGYKLVDKAVVRMRCTCFHGSHFFEGVDSEAEGGHQEKSVVPTKGSSFLD